VKPGAYANTPSVGELQSIDGYMNLALEKCEEYVDGVKKRSYGDAFVRGNNGRPSALEKFDLTDRGLHSDVHFCGLRHYPEGLRSIGTELIAFSIGTASGYLKIFVANWLHSRGG
jgi:LSM domain